MSEQNFPDNVLYELDNLDVLRGMNSNTIDLIATDPPFNTKRNRSGTAGFYVDKWKWGDTGILPDQWRWNEVHPIWLDEIKDQNRALHEIIQATRVCHGEDIAAFLCFLSVRLLEMRRVLKPTGSIYLHCDHTANAYIRMAMDAIFGAKNFRNEIVWCYAGGGIPKRDFPRKHDTIFRYTKSGKYSYHPVYRPYSPGTVQRGRTKVKGVYFDKGLRKEGTPVNDWWSDVPKITSPTDPEKTGSPDQKPLALYERIIQASSDEGDIVLDPFAGCATTPIAARNLGRRWIGIDRRQDARFHVVCRMAGIKQSEAEEIRKRPHLASWIDAQLAKYDAHYRIEPPIRTDEGKPAAPRLEQVYPTTQPSVLSHSEMHAILLDRFGPHCWGCNFDAGQYGERGGRYLELDHVNPKSAGGHDHLDNRALLCGPCNKDKSDRTTLIELRRRTIGAKNARMHRIDLREASAWCRERLMQEIRKFSQVAI